ncbi:MAG TPA: hypothetical protein VLJ61_18075 [Pyrinomonadaceae bacterium]|nr:hypothetical protein [Pyrinomonadaceae bacterium]
MSAILIISVFLIVVASLAILRTKRQPSGDDAGFFQDDARPPLLFGGEDGPGANEKEAEEKASEDLRKNLLARAAQSDFEVLKDANGDAGLYQLVLNNLVESRAGNADELCSLADFIARNDGLRASAALAFGLLEDFERSPSRASLTRLLRVAALSDDAAVFERAMSSIMRSRKDGRLSGMRADELQTLFEGEYWLLSSEAKRSGAGFLLKQRLAHARRELSVQLRRDDSPTAGGANAETSAQKERQ